MNQTIPIYWSCPWGEETVILWLSTQKKKELQRSISILKHANVMFQDSKFKQPPFEYEMKQSPRKIFHIEFAARRL